MFAPRRVLFATDFSPTGNHALGHAVAMAAAYGATLVMAHVVVLHESDPADPEWRFPGFPNKHVEAAIENAGATLDDLDGGDMARQLDRPRAR